MRAGRSIVAHLVLLTSTVSVLILAVTLGYNYVNSRAMLQRELESNARNLATSVANRVEADLVSVAKVAEGLARAVEFGDPSEAELLALMRATLAANPAIARSAVAFEPYAFRRSTRLFAPYYYRAGAEIRLGRLEEQYRQLPYPNWDWYQIPRELERPDWSEPYFDEGAADIALATYSVPIFRTDGGTRVVRGVATAGIVLDSLTNLVNAVRILETGYAALISRNGMILAHPLADAIMNESFFTIAEGRNDPALRAIGRKMVRGESGFVHYTSIVGVRSWMYYTPIRPAGWTLAVVFPEQELLATVNRLTFTMGVMGVAGILLLVAAAVSIATSITKPLRSLALATHRLSEGNFDAPLPRIRAHDEVADLAHDFQAMQASLKQYIADLTETTAAKERIQSELKVATDIQASLLPRVFPPFPQRPEFDIFASMDAAKEVGGDFYDFFLIDDQHLCFLIADVADKGVPAALYMMVAKTLLKTEGQRLRSPERILASVNDLLAADNERCMFATVFCGILDVRTGEVRYANAGHNPPLVVGAGAVRYLAVRPGCMLGPLPGAVFTLECLTLAPGDTLFLYTDGVTEARNGDERLYGEASLQAALEGSARETPEAMIHAIRAAVRAHAGDAPQSDDVTMVALTYRGLQPSPPGAQG
jgi:sigma-B regulation protein RsbU (phosphoserine phosphatase)